MKKFVCFVFWFLTLTPASAAMKAYFSPSLDCENQIIRHLNNSTDTVDIAVYTMTNRPIMRAIEKAHNRGVRIRIITDKKQADHYSSIATRLYQKDIPIKINTEFEIEHNKFAIFDGQSLITGSFNWTYSASNKNSENCLVITDEPELIDQYEKRFNTLWKTYNARESRHFFEQKIDSGE